MRFGPIAANRRRHGTAATPTPDSSDITAYRGALTKQGHGAVNIGNLVSPSFNATGSTYTLTSGTAGHWTTPTDGTFPTPTLAGDTADLNGGPYVYAYTATDGTNSVSGTLTINALADTYTASLRSELATIKTAGFDGKSVQFAKGSTDFANATFASQIVFDWRATTSCTITHEDTTTPCTVGNIKISGGANNLTFDHIMLTPSGRLTANATEMAWYILSNAVGSSSITFNNCGVSGPADPTKTVYGFYMDARNNAVTIATTGFSMTWVQYGFYYLYNSTYAVTVTHTGRTKIRYWTVDANRVGSLTGTGLESIHYEDLVLLSPMLDSTRASDHADGFQVNASAILATDAVVIDRYAIIIADGNAMTQSMAANSATGLPTVKNMISVNREQNAVFIENTSASSLIKLGNVTAINQWSGVWGPEIAGVINLHPDGALNAALVIRAGAVNANIQLQNMFFTAAPVILNSPAYSPAADIRNNAGSPDISATFPNASWISSTSLKSTALANDVDNYSGLADSRWTADTDTVLASVVAALTPSSGTVGAVASDGSRPLATF